jgi:MFS family permease
MRRDDDPDRTESGRARFEADLRRRGLPLMVRHDRRGSSILRRAAPALAFVLVVDPLSSLLAWLLALPERDAARLSNAFWVFVYLAITVAILVAPVVTGWLVSLWLRRLTRTSGAVVAGILLMLTAFVWPVVEWVIGLRTVLWLSLTIDIGLTLLVLLGVYVGAGSILAWGLRCAWYQLGTVGTMATRALPLLVIVVLFAFFSTEMWQIANKLSREKMWWLVAVFAVLSVLFMVAVLREELRSMVDDAASGGLPPLPDKLADIVVDDPPAGTPPLTHGERANVMLVLFLAQALQIVLLAVLVFGLFIGLGMLAVDPKVVDDWVGGNASKKFGALFGFTLPVPNALVQLSIFLSVFSGLYFTASAATDPVYRKAFFDPLVTDVRVSLAVRHAYLAHRGDGA